MFEERVRDQAEAEYFSNVYLLIGTGEGRQLSALDVLHIKLKRWAFQEWYAGLDQKGKQRIDRYLLEKYQGAS
ncbi:hypothetical protein [Desulfofustis glycolicus]|uniref:Uncharacterized protein n=1 Tax=Desulfofustis glycolicus DSM 9705 TaxID=1121409 RepID=A0A1M5UKF6_9BACT|nr:hypothetical protein [Desulfofustis glycolicus]SHH63532.1 hypothetical protein SAMN02745124_01221 [Desulfofustis glycolicus DSM 9705]